MTRFELQPGDVIFPLNNGTPWVVLAWEEGRMLYLGPNGAALWWKDPKDHTFDPGVLIVRGREAVNGRWP